MGSSLRTLRLCGGNFLIVAGNKKPGSAGFFIACWCTNQLLDLAFLVDHMLADHRVEFLDFHLFRHISLVLGRGIEMTGTGAGNELDLVTHDDVPLDLFAAGADIRQYGGDAQFVDNAHALAGNAQFHPALFAIHPETVFMQIGQETPPRLVIGMGDVIAAYRPLSRDLTYSGHC